MVSLSLLWLSAKVWPPFADKLNKLIKIYHYIWQSERLLSNIYVVVFKLEDHHSESEEFFLSTLQMSFQEYFFVS